MKIGVLGAGPAGLLFSLLMKKQEPSLKIRVVEQNRNDATFGWGVVFSDRALSFLETIDEEVYRSIVARMETWEDQAIVHRGEKVRIDGLGFSGIARLALLEILQEHCLRAGVELEFERRVTDIGEFGNCDLIVGADGANSLVRRTYEHTFQPTVEQLTNRYAWYGTRQLFDCLTLTFRQNEAGAFVAHHYRYSPKASTFIVECSTETWANSGMEPMDEQGRRKYCEQVFDANLGVHGLMTNKSEWLRFKLVYNRHWTHENVVLIGDALRTVHFSIGSGTIMAFEDATALVWAFRECPEVKSALAAFERERRPVVDKVLGVAARSFVWYERFREKMDLDPVGFANDYLMRGGGIDRERLRKRSPEFTALLEAREKGNVVPPGG
jgi:anthraniloyl-CoA monooxygenase